MDIYPRGAKPSERKAMLFLLIAAASVLAVTIGLYFFAAVSLESLTAAVAAIFLVIVLMLALVFNILWRARAGGMHIREATESDITAVDKITKLASLSSYSLRSGVSMQDKAKIRHLVSGMNKPIAWKKLSPMLIAESGGAVIGFCSYQTYEIGGVYKGSGIVSLNVDPVFAGNGVDRRLVKAVLERLPAGTVRVKLSASNKAAIALYEQMGFKQSSEKTSSIAGFGTVVLKCVKR